MRRPLWLWNKAWFTTYDNDNIVLFNITQQLLPRGRGVYYYFQLLVPESHYRWRHHLHIDDDEFDSPTSSYVLHPEHGAALRGPVYAGLSGFLSPCLLWGESFITDYCHPVLWYLPDDAYGVYTKPRHTDSHTEYVFIDI